MPAGRRILTAVQNRREGESAVQKLEHLCLFALGGAGYVGVELVWRGFSHWTMFLAGGLALCLLAWLEARPRLPLLPGAALGALGVTGIELAAGLWCARVLHTAVWDYSAEWADLAGLICPKYSLYWFVLCLWALLALRAARRLGGGAAKRHNKSALSYPPLMETR